MENWRRDFSFWMQQRIICLVKIDATCGNPYICMRTRAFDKSRLIPITKHFIGPVFRFVRSTILLPDPLSPAGNIEWFKRHR